MNRFRFAAPAAVAALFVGLLAATPAEAAAKPVARNDSFEVKVNVAKTVNVLVNDRMTIQQKRKAKVRVVAIRGGKGLAARTNKSKKAVVVRATSASAAGKTYKVKYRVYLPKKKTTAAWVVVRVAKPTVTTPTPPPVSPTPTGLAPLTDYVKSLPVKVEDRTGYDRNLFKHWNAGLNATDGCDTRREVLIVEAIKKPKVGSGCSFTGGEWTSAYDGYIFTDASKLDIDHMVPLAEAWDSGASTWNAARREAYANDQGDHRSLIAVSAGSNRSKGDKDPAEWIPSNLYGSYAMSDCNYVASWTAVKVRWSLSVDQTEYNKLLAVAKTCGTNYQISAKKA